MSYPVAACRGHWTAVGGAATPWYLSGGISAANCIAAYQPKGAASLAASYVNLANPGTYNAAPGTAPSFNAATGWTFASASSQYLVTGLVPLVDQSYSVIIRTDLSSANNRCPLFCRGGTNKDFGWFEASTTSVYSYNGSVGLNTYSDVTLDTVLAISTNRAYQNGSILATAIASGSTPTTQDIYIGAGNISGSPTYYIDGNVYAVAVYNIAIAAYVAELTTAMAAL